MNRRRVVVTGMGVVSAAGCDVPSFWAHLVAGRPAVRTVTRFDASAYPSRIAAEIDDGRLPLAAGDWGRRRRIARYAAAATAQAVTDARLDRPRPRREPVGLVLAAGLGTYDHEEVFGPAAAARAAAPDAFDWPTFVAELRGLRKPLALERRTPGSIAAALAREHGFDGPMMSVMTACAGGTQAIGDALRWIRLGRADLVIAGGADSELYPMGLASFCLLGALSTRNDDPAGASRPFDRRRDGFVLGEGAATLVLEEREHARRRGARVYAEVAGFGGASDAYRVTDPHPDGTGAALAMRRAIADARVTAPDIGYVNAHGTSTIANDRSETRALKQVFGDHAGRIPVNATKSMIGHATLAAGAIEAVVTTLTLVEGVAHPTINLEEPDAECDLDYIAGAARPIRAEYALSNSFAFGGQCACLVLGRHRWEGEG